MYFFYNIDTGIITTRAHEYNAEAISGEIVNISSEDKCFLLIHVPTKKFTWEVKIISEESAEKGLSKLSSLGTKKTAKDGQPYYELVLATMLDDYLENHTSLELKSEAKKEKEDLFSPYIPKELVKEVSKKEDIEEKPNTQKTKYKTKLVRDGERPIKAWS